MKKNIMKQKCLTQPVKIVKKQVTESDTIDLELDLQLPNSTSETAIIKKPRNRINPPPQTEENITEEDIKLFNDVASSGFSLFDKMFQSSRAASSSSCRRNKHHLSMADMMKNIINSNNAAAEKIIDLESIPFEEKIQVDKNNNVLYNYDCISGSYYDDLNINIINQIILNNLNKKKFMLPRLEKNLNDLFKIVTLRPFDGSLQKKIKDINDTIDKINNNTDINEYINRAEPYIAVYSSELEKDEKLIIILDYLDVAKKYIKIDLIRNNDNFRLCENCQESLETITPDSNGILSCPNCNVNSIPLFFEKPQQIQDPSKMKITMKQTSSDIKSFKKAYQKYVNGHVEIIFTEKLITDLDQHFRKTGLSSPEVFFLDLEGPIDGRRKRGPTSRTLMINALKTTGHTEYINKDYYLCRYYWHWENPNLSTIHNKLMSDYEISQMEYVLLKGNRRSTLGSEYRLFRQLWHIGYPCHPTEFKIVLTDEFIKTYEEIWEKICDAIGDKLGWKKFIKIEILYMMNYDTLELPSRFD